MTEGPITLWSVRHVTRRADLLVVEEATPPSKPNKSGATHKIGKIVGLTLTGALAALLVIGVVHGVRNHSAADSFSYHIGDQYTTGCADFEDDPDGQHLLYNDSFEVIAVNGSGYAPQGFQGAARPLFSYASNACAYADTVGSAGPSISVQIVPTADGDVENK